MDLQDQYEPQKTSKSFGQTLEQNQETNQEPGQVQDQTDQTDQTEAEAEAPVQSGQIFVKSLTGDTICIDYRPDLTVSELKNSIHSQLQIPVDQQRLIFQGKQLEDANTLADYNIASQNTIHLVLRVKGGDF
jgi:hypothetical protein